MEFTQVEFAPLFSDVYVVDNVNMALNSGTGGGLVAISGAGIYRNSVQSGLQHRLELDLSIGGEPPLHFDSGWVSSQQDPFPNLSMVVVEDSPTCLDRRFELFLEPELFTNYCTSLPNSTGNSALISANGSASLGANDLELVAGNLPPGKPTLFYFGPGSTEVPLGNGFRCVAGPGIARFSPLLSNPAGVAVLAVDNTNLPGGASFSPGSSWHFQAWYRDPAAGQAGFNLTDGAAILFDL